MAISNRTISLLFGLSAGRCNICKIPVVERSVKIGEMAHIIARQEAGPRGRDSISSGRDDYENLILLCPNHHSEVDKDAASYPPEKLYRIKNEHEIFVRQALTTQHQGRIMDASAMATLLQFLPLASVPRLLQPLPERFELEIMDLNFVCKAFDIDYPHCRPFFDAALEHRFGCFRSALIQLIDCAFFITPNGHPYYGPVELHHHLRLTSHLTRDQRNWVESEVIDRSTSFANEHGELISYLRKNYGEISIAGPFR